MKKKLYLIFALCLLTLTVSTVFGASVTLNAAETELAVGQSTTLKISGVKSSKAKWKSSKASVAKVSKTGKVTAKKAGTATITAKYKGISFKCNVTVVPKQKKVVLYNDSKYKITLTGLSSDKVTFSFQNKTDEEFKLSMEYLMLNDEYYDDIYDDGTIPANATRKISFGRYEASLSPVSAKYLQCRFATWECDTGYKIEGISVKKTKVK